MSKSIRIRTTPNGGDKYVKVKLDQDFDFVEILSLKISQEEVYKTFCSDYGVVVGRVIVNSGFGVPNAKISIFVPLTDDDQQNEEIRDLYPFQVVTDKDSEGVRYNLLSKDSQGECHTPVGTHPSKRETLDNDTTLEVYQKYYKFTTTTNEAGDFMIFGVPVGNHILHMDVDMSDIGIVSQRPYDFISQGNPEKQFESTTKFKGGTNLDNLVQIKSRNVGVNVVPFWGDVDDCEIGITRADIDLNYTLTPSAIFMGSIFGDSEKHSINKRCRPRKKLGKVCETITSEGGIEILRKELDGTNQLIGFERIDEDGCWAFQVPMNLDYMVTDEFGNLVPSEDTTRGIPTRALSRFRIGMDPTGGEGRLRTRAKYLVPHNPDVFAESDYSFDETTGNGLNGDKHFAELKWNKIYTVKNLITRFQTAGGGNNRNMIGMKDVDDCPGLKTPFPYNRMDTDLNPLYTILCLLITIITIIVSLINSVVLTLINAVLFIINAVLRVICNVIWGLRFLTLKKSKKCKFCIGTKITDSDGNCTDCDCREVIPYLPCITLGCDDEQYAPGCFQGGVPLPWSQTNPPFHYPNDGHTGHAVVDTIVPDGGFINCVSLTLAQNLDVFELDFYNDWVNGTLYSFLLKYKKKKKGKEKFCEYDCDDFPDGVDGNNDGNPDNKCKNNKLVDTCATGCSDAGVKCDTKLTIRDGLIKKFDDELYYAAFTHSTGHKLYATDVVNLGAILDCDLDGAPSIHEELVPTSYIIPPLTDEFDDTTNDLVVAGMDSGGFINNNSLFFNISCLGLSTDAQNCTNLRRICEIGVGLDEDRSDEPIPIGCSSSGVVDWKIDNCDIDNLFIRNAFAFLNEPTFTTPIGPDMLFGSSNYDLFRGLGSFNITGLDQSTKDTYVQPEKNSFYFYFGTEPGNSALEKMNRKFFIPCRQERDNDFIILCNATTDVSSPSASDGAIDIEIIGGVGPYTYSWTGPFGFVATTQDITGLVAGTYTVTVVDSEGNQATSSCIVSGPFPVNCDAAPTPVSISAGSDGQILVNSVFGGVSPYTVTIFNTTTTTTYPSQTIISPANSTLFTGLNAGVYTYTVVDSSPTPLTCTGTTEVLEPTPLVLTFSGTAATCFGFTNGTLSLSLSGGVAPYTATTTGPSSYTSTLFNQTGLAAGTYTINAVDSIGQTAVGIFNVTEPAQIVASLIKTDITCFGADDGTIVPNITSGGVPPFTFLWTADNSSFTSTTPALAGLSADTYSVTMTDSNGCNRNESIEIIEPPELLMSFLGSTDPLCNGDANGTISVSAIGGTPARTFIITSGPTINTTGAATGVFTGLLAGAYTITVTDINGCSPAATVMTTLTDPPVLTAVPTFPVGGFPKLITANAAGGTPPYTYEWSASPLFVPLLGTAPTQSVSSAGTYYLRVTDNNGCIFTTSIAVV